MIKCDCADDADGNEQQQKTVNSAINQIHRNQSRLKSIQTLTKAAAFMTDVRQADE